MACYSQYARFFIEVSRRCCLTWQSTRSTWMGISLNNLLHGGKLFTARLIKFIPCPFIILWPRLLNLNHTDCFVIYVAGIFQPVTQNNTETLC